MRFRSAQRSMTLDDLELYKFEFSDGPTAKRMKLDQYCHRQRCKHVDRRIGAFFGMLSRREGLSATAGLSCFQSCPI